MTLLPEVRRQLSEAAERQVSSRRTGGLARSVRARGLGRRPSLRVSHVALALSVVVVAAVAVAFLGSRGSSSTGSRAAAVQVIFRAHPTPQAPHLSTQVLSRAVAILRHRLGSAFHDFSVTLSPNLGVAVVVRHTVPGDRDRIIALSAPARLYFYDWEADALTSDGRSVASQLITQSQNAAVISQGSGSGAPGSPGAGSVSLYDAVKLASEQKRGPVGSFNSHLGALYYRFGAAGSAACAKAGRFYGFRPAAGRQCLLSGPDPSIPELNAALPPGVTATTGEVLSVPQGIVVLQASPASFGHPSKPTDPSAQFFVLADHAGLVGSDITNPRPSTDAAGSPDVAFGFDSRGRRQFRAITSRVARRGAVDSTAGQQFDQHFAVALDAQLITVPSIDFKQYPDGIVGEGGADLTAGFTHRSAHDLATLLRFGALAVQLTAAP